MNRQFAALRGIAMILVVFHHAVDLTAMVLRREGIAPLSGLVKTFFITPLYELGIYAVPLFLFVSGAFMAYAAKGDPPTISWTIVRNALKRLVWPYLIWSILLYILVFFHYGEVHSPTEYLKKLVIGSPFDFVPLLFFFYLVSPWLVRWGKGRRGILLLVGIGLLQLVVMNIEAPGILGFRFPDWAPGKVPLIGTTLAQFALFFPLGLVYSLNAAAINPRLEQGKRPLLFLTLALFIVHLLHAYGLIRAPIVQYLAAAVGMMYTPLINRTSIPQVRRVEIVGKHSYGLYLSHFFLLDLLLFAVASFVPRLLSWPLPLTLLMFVLGLFIPVWLMEKLSRTKRARPVYRYLFG
jgi:surface polysaccharide O-acyltransferase-like enzyme